MHARSNLADVVLFRLAFVGMIATASTPAFAHGERDLPSEDKPAAEGVTPVQEESFSLHFQFTAATQYHPAFSAKYSGANSLDPVAECATAFVSTLYLAHRLWTGCELLFDPE